jgi:hypothetical protein
MTAPDKPNPRWFQFSLTTLLLTIAAFPCGLYVGKFSYALTTSLSFLGLRALAIASCGPAGLLALATDYRPFTYGKYEGVQLLNSESCTSFLLGAICTVYAVLLTRRPRWSTFYCILGFHGICGLVLAYLLA